MSYIVCDLLHTWHYRWRRRDAKRERFGVQDRATVASQFDEDRQFPIAVVDCSVFRLGRFFFIAPMDALLKTDSRMLDDHEYSTFGARSAELSICISGPEGIAQGTKCNARTDEVCSPD